MFYTFVQNNSGGWFHRDSPRGISRYVIVEANTPREANERAVKIGLYFDGVYDEIDCECCGDRWLMVDHYDAKDVPSIYNDPIGETVKDDWTNGAYIHYLDGTVKHVPNR